MSTWRIVRFRSFFRPALVPTEKFLVTRRFVFAAILCQEYSSECPEKVGEQTYAHQEYCDQFYLCTNGTLTLEQCGNGLLYDGKGAAYHHCNYHWAVECGNRKAERTLTGKKEKRF